MISSSSVSNRIIYVDDDGGKDYTKIQDAINASNYGDTVFVYSGIYNEKIKLNRNTISLVGENKNTTIIYGDRIGVVVDISPESNYNVDDSIITGFTISHNDCNSWLTQGLSVSDAVNISINNNNIHSNCIGINIYCSNQINISNNYIVRNGDFGIVVDQSNDIIVNRNLISDNDDWGIISDSNISIFNNIVSNNHIGIDVRSNFEFRNPESIIFNNIIINNMFGIYIDSINNLIVLNNISSNNNGVYLSSRNNWILKNNFFKNNLDAYHIDYGLCRLSDFNKWDSNYWEKPRIFPKIVIGNIVLLLGPDIYKGFTCINFDWNPAQEPYYIPIPEVT